MKNETDNKLPTNISWRFKKVVEHNVIIQQCGGWDSMLIEGKFSAY